MADSCSLICEILTSSGSPSSTSAWQTKKIIKVTSKVTRSRKQKLFESKSKRASEREILKNSLGYRSTRKHAHLVLEQSCPVDGCSSSFTASCEEHGHSKHHFPLPSPRTQTQTQTLPPHSSEYKLAKHSRSVPTSHPANNRARYQAIVLQCCSRHHY